MRFLFLCKLRHRFEYYENTQPLRIGQLVLQKRRCKRCGIIEVQSLVTSNWHEVPPSKEEIRDIKIDDILS